MYNIAIMKITPNISVDFSVKVRTSPAVMLFCSVPLRHQVTEFSRCQRWAIEYHAKDSGIVSLRDGPVSKLRREADTIHVYSPRCYYSEDSAGADFPAQEHYMIVSGGDLCDLDELIEPISGFARFFDYEKKVGQLFEESLEACVHLGAESFWLVQAKLMEILHRLHHCRRLDEVTYVLEEPGQEKEVKFSDTVMNFMRRNPSKSLRISDIASYMKVSESTLNHKFKEETGKTPIACMLEQRIDYAKGLLLKGTRLKSIAEAAGFHDEYHLSRTFKKITGKSPRQFRGR